MYNTYLVGNIELFYEAKQDGDADMCASKARMTVDRINDLGKASNRGRRQAEEGSADPIFNLVNVAASLEASTPEDTDGGDANVIIASYSLLFVMLLTVLMF